MAKQAMKSFLGVIDQKGINVKARTVTGYGSTGTVDRYGEVVLPEAFERDLKNFLDHRHLFAAGHRYVSFDGEPLIIGKVLDGQIDDHGLKMEAQFDEDELAEKWWSKYKSGTINAFSIGFIPVKSEYRKLAVKNGEEERKVLHYTEVELLEISAVPIPANRESMVTAGLEDMDPEILKVLTQKIGEAVLEKVAKELEEIRTHQKDGFNMVTETLAAVTERLVRLSEGFGSRKDKDDKKSELMEMESKDFRSALGL